MITVSPTPASLHHPKPCESASKRLSRSPKRVRSTPPTADTDKMPASALLNSVSSSASSSSSSSSASASCASSTGSGPSSSRLNLGQARPPLSSRRGISYGEDTDRHVKTSPWRSREPISDWGLNRRREMSVPLVSRRFLLFMSQGKGPKISGALSRRDRQSAAEKVMRMSHGHRLLVQWLSMCLHPSHPSSALSCDHTCVIIIVVVVVLVPADIAFSPFYHRSLSYHVVTFVMALDIGLQLSQSLSTFSLSQPDANNFGLFPAGNDESENTTPAAVYAPRSTFPFHTRTPSNKLTLRTPRRTPGHNAKHSFFGDLTSDHVHPSTAPLPQIPAFLGSPFSSKNARGGYRFHPLSPSKGIMTERIGHGGFDNLHHDWMDRTEWMYEQQEQIMDDASDHIPSRISNKSPKTRRDPSSVSSIEDICDSGTSSSSLMSLGRSSGEQGRPSIVTVWSDSEIAQMDEEEEEDPATPSRQLFGPSSTAVDILEMSVKTKDSPAVSPLEEKARSRQRSPLQVFFMRTPETELADPIADVTTPTAGSVSGSMSKTSSLLPRLISSRKSSRASPTSPAITQFSVNQHSQSLSQVQAPRSVPPAPISRLPMSKSRRSLLKDFTGANCARTEPRCVQIADWTPSVRLSEESDPDESPSKVTRSEILRSSATSSTTISSNTASTSGTDSPCEPARGALLTRRKTLASQPSAKFKAANSTLRQPRPVLRRGVTDPRGEERNSNVFSPEKTFSTPVSALFGDEKPSPAAFASTGLVKKKSGTPGLEIPRFGDSEPVNRFAGLPRITQPVKSRLGIMIAQSPPTRTSSLGGSSIRRDDGSLASVSAPPSAKTNDTSSSDASVSAYARAAQQTRGLRRKTSSMFGPSTSTSSIADSSGAGGAASPATPTKPGLFSVPGLGITTPSPIAGGQNVYPFASSSVTVPSSAYSSRHGFHDPTSPIESSPAPVHSFASRLTRTIKRPIARASNPMLAESFKMDGAALSQAKKASKVGSNEALRVGGSRLDKEFAIVHSLGKGEFSQVWKVVEKSTGVMYAVKAGRTYTGYKNRLRQLEEVSILRQLSLDPHANILTFVDSWEHSNRLFIRTELASCGDFATFLLTIADAGAMGEARLWKTLYELSLGLKHIHSNHFVHLDLKPSNILITQSGSLKIADFGMSLLVASNGEIGGVSPALPKSGNDGEFLWSDACTEGVVPVPSPILDREVEGDREYLCPEALSERTVGAAADMYSLGILLLESALNVVLPSNGDGWVKLRNDDFSDTLEHYLPRESDVKNGCSSPRPCSNLPLLSSSMIDLIKGLMCSRPLHRWTLDRVFEYEPFKKMARIDGTRSVVDSSRATVSDANQGQDATATRHMTAALVEEDEGFLRMILDVA
ncbi:hypothetical protein BD324DRAFT_588590 [Kockovaella imperatae]|uniref:Protein kinase domain-containing protein n=1 Tax=Kockovaella imperatae TaxID=4999 RepID=A0A1Y1UJQ7_9TREE|nr:hypothetical protein BD324DRAFT_588590 [Kockovaella imperatae]ORX38288.1 hypothetical protein BD324DRAFT_588590 [Kockovaella imperatae]